MIENGAGVNRLRKDAELMSCVDGVLQQLSGALVAGNQQNLALGMKLRDGKRGLNPVHGLHHHVGHYIIEGRLPGQFQGSRAAVSRGRVKPADVESHDKSVGDYGIVIDHKNSRLRSTDQDGALLELRS